MGKIVGRTATLPGRVIALARDDPRAIVVTDGTPEGTRRFDALPPGGLREWLGEAGGVQFFSYSATGTIGLELWRTDGTPEGTIPLGDLNPGPSSSYPEFLALHSGRLYFYAFSIATGSELWVSDGSVEGTRVHDIYPGERSSYACWVSGAPGGVYVSATDPVVGQELLHVDESTQEITVVGDFAVGSTLGSSPRSLVQIGSELGFTAEGPAGQSVWLTDGSESGTVGVQGLPPAFSSYATLLRSPSGALMALSRNSGQGSSTLWSLDGAPAPRATGPGRFFGSVSLRNRLLVFFRGELWAGDGSGQMEPLYRTSTSSEQQMLVVGPNVAYFLPGARLDWVVTDATAGSTRTVPGSATSWVSGAAVVGDDLVFLGEERDGRSGLWRVNGETLNPPELVVDNPYLANGQTRMVSFGKRALFFSDDNGRGREPWMTDGTSAGTKPLFLDGAADLGTPYFPFKVIGQRAYFSMGSSTLWSFDGSGEPVLVTEGSGRPSGSAGFTHPVGELEGELLFSHNDGPYGDELWITEGDSARLFADLNPGSNPSVPREALRVGDRLFVSADIEPYGAELFVLRRKTPEANTDSVFPVSTWMSAPFPNPAATSTRVIIRASSAPVRLSLYDLVGRRVWDQELAPSTTGERDVSIPLRSLPAAAYFLTAVSKGDVMTRRLIVAR